MKYTLIFLLGMHSLFGAEAPDQFPPAIRSVITMCQQTAYDLSRYYMIGEDGMKNYRLAIHNEHDRAMQVYMFGIARAMLAKRQPLLDWGRQSLYGEDWQIRPFSGHTSYSIPLNITSDGKGLELSERVHDSYDSRAIQPVFERVMQEFCDGVWRKSMKRANTVIFVKTEPLDKIYAVDEPEGLFLRALIAKSGLHTAQMNPVKGPCHPGHHHNVYLEVQTDDIAEVDRALGLRLPAE